MQIWQLFNDCAHDARYVKLSLPHCRPLDISGKERRLHRFALILVDTANCGPETLLHMRNWRIRRSCETVLRFL